MLKIVDEDSTSVTVRGAKMLGTSSIMANEVFVAHLQRLTRRSGLCDLFRHADGNKGLKVLSRKSYEQHAVSDFDNPPSARYDENDALMFFDDVKKENGTASSYTAIEYVPAPIHDTPGHIYQNYQAQIRLTVKLKFLVGLAREVCETTGTVKLPPVPDALGKKAAQAAAVENMMWGMEAKGSQWGKYFVPDRHAVYAAQTLTQEYYPMMINTLRELAGGALIMLPSSTEDLDHPELAAIAESVQVSADGRSAKDRIKMMKLVWDAVGSEFAGRHTQYEMFYAGASSSPVDTVSAPTIGRNRRRRSGRLRIATDDKKNPPQNWERVFRAYSDTLMSPQSGCPAHPCRPSASWGQRCTQSDSSYLQPGCRTANSRE